MLVDAHHHLWDIEARPQPWMRAPGYEPLARTHDAAEHARLAGAAGVDASVVVQCVADVAETRELLEIAAADPVITGVVGWVDLTAPDVADVIAELRDGPGGSHLRGIRHQVHDEADVDWLRRADVRRGIAAVGAAGLAYDLLLRPAHFPAAIDTARSLPDVRFVLDHLGKPEIEQGRIEPWATLLRELAALGTTTCKLSGLVTEASWTAWTPDQLRPYAEVALDAFGADRTMVGSDWPVCTLATDHATAVGLADVLLPGLSDAERRAVRGATAVSVYGLPAAAP